MKEMMTAHEAFQKLAALCARSEHCQQDMIEKMRRWGLTEEEQAQVMARLVGGRYVDDERFARAFINDKVRYNRWGRRKVEQALWMKRIDADMARRLLDEVDDADYIQALKPLLVQKRRSTKASSDYDMRRKLIAFAVGRGFTMDIIRQCTDVDDEDEFLD